jgi:glycerol-3-phosphate O-acyltransferase
LRALSSERRHLEIALLGERLMSEVGSVVPVLPVSLVATAVLAGGGQGLSSLELKGAVYDLMQRLKLAGAHVHIPRQDQEYAVDVGLRMLVLRRMVVLDSGVYRANPDEHALLTYYGNAIAHLWARPGGPEGAPLI